MRALLVAHDRYQQYGDGVLSMMMTGTKAERLGELAQDVR